MAKQTGKGNNKKLLVLMIVALVWFMALVAFLWFNLTKIKTFKPTPSLSPSPSLLPSPSPSPSPSPLASPGPSYTPLITGWQTYYSPDKKYRFDWPNGKLNLEEKNGKITFSHAIDFRHPDPCEFRDVGPAILDQLTDFKVILEVVKQPLKQTVLATEGDYFSANFLGDKLKIEPGFIDQYQIADLTGYLITSGVEGCGRFNYYFALGDQQTLVVSRAFVPELQPIVQNYQENLSLPGIIAPNEADQLFNNLLSSFSLL